MGQVTDKRERKANRDGKPAIAGRTGLSKATLALTALAVAIAVAAAVYYFRGGFDQSARVAGKDKTDPSTAELMAPGPLPDLWIGSANAPYTIVEYASMTCPHCGQFQTQVMPQLKTKYIDTGKARYVLREFPLDGLALAAFMLARCSGDDRYYAMVDALFQTQETWAVPGGDGKERLLKIARQAGISKEQFDKCLGDKELFNKIVQTREIAHEKFQVDSTPTFFVNGKRLSGDHQLKDFDLALGETPAEAPATAKGATTEGTTPPAGGATTEGTAPPSESPKTEGTSPSESPKTEGTSPSESPRTEGTSPLESPRTEGTSPSEGPKTEGTPAGQ
jgi:protein-disulfide isomerase